MLTLEEELKVVGLLVQSDNIVHINKKTFMHDVSYFVVTLTVSDTTNMTIIDDSSIKLSHEILIEFTSNEDINKLNIRLKAGKYHNKGDIVGTILNIENFDDLEFDNNRITLRCNNNINELTLYQKLCTEDIYSYYGNQDGFNSSLLLIRYNSEKYKNISVDSNKLSISTGTFQFNDGHYDLCIKLL